MFKNIAKVWKKHDEVTTIKTDEVVLEALCAYRDRLIVSEDWENNLDVAAKLSLIAIAIDEVRTLPI